jgi:hypothetical protein
LLDRVRSGYCRFVQVNSGELRLGQVMSFMSR